MRKPPATTLRKRLIRVACTVSAVIALIGAATGPGAFAAEPSVAPALAASKSPSHDSYIEVNGERYFVRDTQQGSEAVLLVHGMPDDGDLWRHQIPALAAAGYRVIAADNLGTGKSSRPADPLRYKDPKVLADLAGILDALGVQKVHYVGHDVGAGLGWQFVMTYPGRVLSFVPITVGHPLSLAEGSLTEEGARSNWYLMVNQTPDWSELWRAGNGRLASVALATHPEAKTVLPMLLEPGVLESYMMIDRVNPITHFLIAYANGTLGELPPITLPVFGIAGTRDVFMWQSQVENSGTYLKGEWRFAAIQSGHWVPLEAPQETNKLLLDWLGRHSSK